MQQIFTEQDMKMGDEITVEELSDLSGRFNYEFVCCLGRRIPRVYRKGGRIVRQVDYYS